MNEAEELPAEKVQAPRTEISKETSTEMNEAEEISAEKVAAPRAENLEGTLTETDEAEELPAEKVRTPRTKISKETLTEIDEAEELPAEKVQAPRAKILKETSTKVEEDFDWDAFEGTKSTNSTANKQEMMDLYDNTLSILQEKEVVDGKVISMNKREVVVDIGYKSDGIVSL